MCGRIFKGLPEGQLDTSFGPPSTKQIADWLQRVLAARNGPLFEELKPGVNVAPTQDLEFLIETAEGRQVLTGRWGLEPHWVKDPKGMKGAPLFNARSESAAEKPSFRDAMKRNRAVIPVAAFYEWQVTDDGKQPWLIYRADSGPLLLAGLYARHSWGDSCTVLTTSANTMMANLHDRMPVILAPESVERWLDPSITDPQLVEDLMVPSPNEWLAAYKVSKAVGNTRNQDPNLVEPIAEAA